MILKEFSCTKCGSKETVANEAVEPLKANGKMPKETFVATEHQMIPLLNPSSVALTVPMLIIHWDVCIECGTRYPTRAEVVDAPVSIQRTKGGGLGFPPGPPQFPMGRG